MKAIVYDSFGSLAGGEYLEVPEPELKPGTVLVHVLYAGVIPFDVKVIEGTIPMPHIKFPFTPGAEFSGVIAQVANDVENFAVGEYVCGNPTHYGGAFADQLLVKASELCKIPPGLALELAGACPVSALAAWHALFNDGSVKKGDHVLLVGASGNVGSFAVQFAAQAELVVYAIGSAQYEANTIALGADHYLDYKKDGYLEGLPKFDMVVDLVGGENQKKLVPLLKEGGTLVSLVQEPDPEELNLYNVKGIMLNSGSNPQQLEEILELIQLGEIKVNISMVLLMQDAVMGLQEVKNGKENGKVLLKN